MTDKARILIVDDDQDILIAGKLLLRRQNFDVVTCHEPDRIPELLKKQRFQIILLDMNFGPGESSGQQGLNWLDTIRSIAPDSVVVMITAHAGMNLAIEAMKRGATDFVTKPWQNEKLLATVSSAVQLAGVKEEAKQLRSTNKVLTEVANQNDKPKILGNSHALKNVMSLVERSAPTDANVLILGENGTGKELIARELHRLSHRQNEIFMTVDLGAVSETLFESELFGHKKGAFTGANGERIGKLEAANGGTLFLDELSNLPLHLQAKLLTVLEQRVVTPLGANVGRRFDVRVICATNATRDRLLDQAHFRQDLLFRLNTVEITLPPLRERPEDIGTIARYYHEYYCKKYQRSFNELDSDTLDGIKRYSWPGNIRSLRHAVERAVILCDSGKLRLSDFQLNFENQSASTARTSAVQASNAQLGTYPELESGAQDDLELNLEQIEKITITKALRTYRYNISHTAKALGLTRAALYRRMEKHEL